MRLKVSGLKFKREGDTLIFMLCDSKGEMVYRAIEFELLDGNTSSLVFIEDVYIPI